MTKRNESHLKIRARPQNLWGIDIRLAHFRPINKAFMGLFYRDLFRSDIFLLRRINLRKTQFS